MEASMPDLKSRAVRDEDVGVVDMVLALDEAFPEDLGMEIGMEGADGCAGMEANGPPELPLGVGYQVACWETPLDAIPVGLLVDETVLLAEGLEADDDWGSCSGDVDDDTDAFRDEGAVFERLE